MKHYRTWNERDADTARKWTLRNHYEEQFRQIGDVEHSGCSGEACLNYYCFLGRQANHMLARHLVVGAESRWLEVGCGEASISRYFANRGVPVYLIDAGRSALRLARSNFRKDGLSPHVQQGDGFALPFRDGTFDVVGCSGVLENLPDSERLVAEMARVLKPGGFCFAIVQVYTKITVQSLVLPLVYVKGLLTSGFRAAREKVQGYRECPHPVNPASLEEYRAMMFAAGCRTLKVWNVNPFPVLPLGEIAEGLYVRAIRLILKLQRMVGIREPFATWTGLGKTWVVIAQK